MTHNNSLSGHSAGLTGATIRLARLAGNPLAKVRKARTRECCFRTVAAPRMSDSGFGWSGYLASPTPPENRQVKYVRMDSAGCAFNMRVEYANDLLPCYSRLRGTNGYYSDDYQESTVIPYVVRLNRGRGFLAACGEGPGMWFNIDAGIIRDSEEAARAAHDLAERTAEREREYRAEQDALLVAEERRQEFLDSVDVSHIDTCVSCYLQDHHTRNGELLLGVAVDGASTYAQVEESLLAEFDNATWNDDVPDSLATPLDEAVRAAIAKEFGRVHDKTRALFDSSLDCPPSDDPDSDEYDSAVDGALSTDDPDDLRATACEDAKREWESAETCYAWFLITYDASFLAEES